MKNNTPSLFLAHRLLFILMCTLLGPVVCVKAQTGSDYSVVWPLDSTLVGVTDSPNFLPQNLSTVNVYAGNTNIIGNKRIYIPDEQNGYAYNLRDWGSAQSGNDYIELRVSVTMQQFNMESVSFRVRRGSTASATQFAVRTSLDNFQANTGASVSVTSLQTFEQLSFPVSFTNIDTTTFAFRIYAFGTSGITGPTSLVAFDAITLNGSLSDTPLPVDLTRFEAEAYGANVMLSWETTYERNSKEFVVERSNDLKEFVEIGTVPAGGDTDGRRQYSYVDKTTLSGINYYRLKMVDRDLTFSTSNVKDAIVRPDAAAFLVAPNPLINNRLIGVRLYKMDASELVLRNAKGQSLSFKISHAGQDMVELIPDSPLATGIYHLSTRSGSMIRNVKILAY